MNCLHLQCPPIQGAQQKSTWDMAVNEPGRVGEEEYGSNGQAQPSPPRQFIRRLSASVALCLDWKPPASQKVNLLLKSTDKHCSQSRRDHMKKTEVIWIVNCVWLAPSTWLLCLFIEEKGSTAISDAKNVAFSCVMLNVLFFCVPITAKAAVLLLERRLMGSLWGKLLTGKQINDPPGESTGLLGAW